MAAATLIKTSYGVQAHTGTDATPVITNRVNLLAVEIMGTAGSETVIVTDKNGIGLLKGTVATASQSQIYDYYGASVDGLIVTLSAGTVRANFIFG